MAAKILFLLALLIPSSLITAQIYKGAFSVELKIIKTNFAFGEDVKLTVILKNVSGKSDSLSNNEIEDLINVNLKIFQNGKSIGCEVITSYFVGKTHKNFQPNEELEKEVFLNFSCGRMFLGSSGYNILDTGFYNCFSVLHRTIYSKNIKPLYEKIKSNEVFFRVNLPDTIEMKAFSKLESILNNSREQFKDTSFKIAVLRKLDEFTRENINSYFGDVAFQVLTFYVLADKLYKDEGLNLSAFYLKYKPNGTKISNALNVIYKNEISITQNKAKALEKIEEYILKYPETEVEKEGKKLIIYRLKQKE